MLVHTAQYSAVHLRQRERIRDHLDNLRRLNASGDEAFVRDMRSLRERELSAVDGHGFGKEPVSSMSSRPTSPRSSETSGWSRTTPSPTTVSTTAPRESTQTATLQCWRALAGLV